MTIAPERNTETAEASARAEEAAKLEAPRVTSRGHLALVDWNSAAAEPALLPKSIEIGDPVRRSRTDRLFERGVVLLLLSTIVAVLASLAHL